MVRSLCMSNLWRAMAGCMEQALILNLLVQRQNSALSGNVI